jgi:exopolyphosphatase/guanosine-5'-triphosphate,3'-diphosphate pyrophosphatase
MTLTDTAAPAPTAPETDPTLIAAMDIGTNSIRMSLVRLDPDTGTWTVMSQHKETVRLGQGEFETREISDEAITRGVLVLRGFAQIARGRGASEIVAIATAALREAENREGFIERARAEAGVEVRVVPGVEEARLIYLGVASGLEINGRKGLFIDIGGGSTELIVGTQTEHLLLESLKLGAIRVGNEFLQGVTGPVSPALFEQMQRHVRVVATHALRKVDETGFDVAVASSGTAMNLAAVAARRAGLELANVRNYTLKTEDLRAVTAMLCKLTLEERRRVPGLNPERADIIISGAAVLQTLADDLRINGLLISDRSLREGVLVDAIRRRNGGGGGADTQDAGVRRRSIARLTALVEKEQSHARHVAHLALSLFDQTRELRLHDGGPHERELLEYAALLHDIGIFVAHTAHHRHSYYLIRHSELAGFTDEEIQIIANLAYFHRKSPPKKRHAHFNALGRDTQRTVRRLAALLRLAEGLDRSHLARIQNVRLTVEYAPGPTAVLTLEASSDPHLEVWYVSSERAAFQDAFDMPLEVRVAAPATAPA